MNSMEKSFTNLFNKTKNKKAYKDFIRSELTKAYEKGVKDTEDKVNAITKAVEGSNKMQKAMPEKAIRIEELQWVLDNCHGGGDWRRIIYQRKINLKG